MLRRHTQVQRRGATIVEAAIVYPVLMLLMIGLVVMGLGVLRYHQVASLAREGARWASVHGGTYESETSNPKATPTEVYNQAISPMAVGLNSAKLTYTVSWADAGQMPTYTDASGNVQTNRVTVTVNYDWTPEAYFARRTLTSTSVMAISY